MDITSLFLSDIVTTAQSSGNILSLNTSGANFSNVMKDAEINQLKKVESTSKIEPHKDNFQQNNKSKEKNSVKTGALDKGISTNDDEKANEYAVNADNKNVKKTELPREEFLYEDVIKDISDAIGLEENVVIQILNSLNLTPLDLFDKSNLNLFMQKAFNLDNPVDLLDISNISEIIKKITSVVDNLAELTVEFDKDVDFVEDTNIKNEFNNDVKMLQSSQSKNEDIISNYLLKDTDKSIQATNVYNDDIEQPKDLNKEVKVVEILDNSQGFLSENSEENQNLHNILMNSISDLDTEIETEFRVVENVLSDIKTTTTQSISTVKSTSLVNSKDVIRQIVNKMIVEVKKDVSEIKITLTPETLGSVSLKISTQNGMIAAQFLAENQKIKEIIESNFEQLKDSLQKQGIEVSELSVFVGQEQKDAMMNQFNQSRQKSSRRIQQIMNSFNSEEDIENNLELSNGLDGLDSTVNYRA